MSKIYMFLILIFSPLLVFAEDLPSSDVSFLSDVFKLVGQFGGLPWMAKVAGVSLLLVASMKVSFLKPLWDKLGAVQVWVAPVFGLVAGILSQGASLSWAGVLAYVGAGAGAILLHQLLDSVKAIPGLGAIYVSIINFIEAIPFLGSGGSPSAPVVPLK